IHFDLAPKPLFFIYVVTHWLYSVQLGFQRWQRHTLLQFLVCVGCSELRMCMALSVGFFSFHLVVFFKRCF
ncbi:MAG: hypothetical protein KDD20_13600, partial [Mangrovimonas sp.]|nr:hypothetical protein [Mangrovimonas sp.]